MAMRGGCFNMEALVSIAYEKDSNAENLHRQACIRAILQACQYTGRSKVIVIENVNYANQYEFGQEIQVETVPVLKIALLCKVIAESNERIAAIIVSPLRHDDLIHKRFIRRVRELASAEGALFVWDGGKSRLEFYEVRPDLLMKKVAQ